MMSENWSEKTQDILSNYFNNVENFFPVDYNNYIKSDQVNEDSEFPTLPEGTLIVAAGLGGEDQDLLIIKTPEGTYHIVDEYEGLEDFDETPKVDLSTPVGELYSIDHYENGTYYQYTSYTSLTGMYIHNLVDDVDPTMGGFYTLDEEFVKKSKYNPK